MGPYSVSPITSASALQLVLFSISLPQKEQTAIECSSFLTATLAHGNDVVILFEEERLGVDSFCAELICLLCVASSAVCVSQRSVEMAS
jgi:hypothetical protein